MNPFLMLWPLPLLESANSLVVEVFLKAATPGNHRPTANVYTDFKVYYILGFTL
jgi:hypothetical protein